MKTLLILSKSSDEDLEFICESLKIKKFYSLKKFLIDKNLKSREERCFSLVEKSLWYEEDLVVILNSNEYPLMISQYITLAEKYQYNLINLDVNFIKNF